MRSFVLFFTSIMTSTVTTSSTFIWDNVTTVSLLKLYECQAALYNPSLESYRDRTMKENAWQKIALSLECSATEVKKKIHNLRSQFATQLKLVEKYKKGGAGTGSIYRPKWRYYAAMSFLIPYLTSKEALNTDDIEETAEDSSEVAEEGPPPKKMKKATKSAEEEILVRAPKSLEGKPDNWEIFGNFVGSELRQLKSAFIRNSTKRKIQKILLDASELDDTS